jgi:AcrR family transcriptional regulator
MKTDDAKPRRPRGRPRSFDREAALERAMEVFWRQGFEGSSLQDLTKAMGINPPSLYAAFGDKERLYLECVERYQAKHGGACPYESEPTARGAIAKLLLYMATELTKACNPRGCMMVMSAATCSGSSEEMQSALHERRKSSRAHIKERIDRGIREGDVAPGVDSAALADFYAAVMSGMSLQARDGASRKSLLATVETAMRAWPPRPEGASEARKRASKPAKRPVTA